MIKVADLQNVIENVQYCVTTRSTENWVFGSVFTTATLFYRGKEWGQNADLSWFTSYFIQFDVFIQRVPFMKKLTKLTKSKNILQQTIFTPSHKHLKGICNDDTHTHTPTNLHIFQCSSCEHDQTSPVYYWYSSPQWLFIVLEMINLKSLRLLF